MTSIDGNMPIERDRHYLAQRLRDIKIAARMKDLAMIDIISEEIHYIFELTPVEDKGREEYERREASKLNGIRATV